MVELKTAGRSEVRLTVSAAVLAVVRVLGLGLVEVPQAAAEPSAANADRSVQNMKTTLIKWRPGDEEVENRNADHHPATRQDLGLGAHADVSDDVEGEHETDAPGRKLRPPPAQPTREPKSTSPRSTSSPWLCDSQFFAISGGVEQTQVTPRVTKLKTKHSQQPVEC